jgi:invasion protein IalB
MRRIIPLATTVAVIAATAVSAGQRTMEIPGQGDAKPSFAPPMFDATAKAEPAKEWPGDRKAAAAPIASTNAKEDAPTERSVLEKEVSTPSAGPASTAKVTDVAAEPKKADEPTAISRKTSSSLREKTAPKTASSVPVKPGASSVQSEAKNDVPNTEKKRDGIRDVTSAPMSDEASLEKAKDEIRAQMRVVQKDAAETTREPQKGTTGVEPKVEQKVEAVQKIERQKVEPPRPHFTGTQGRAKPIALAGLRGDDDTGDRLSVSRMFHAWTLRCAMQVSRNEKICGIHQTLNDSGPDRFAWQLATTAAGKPVVVFEFSADADAEPGLHISIAGFDKIVPATEWACDAGRCTGSMPIVGPVSSWFTNTSQIQFSYRRNGAPVTIAAAMTGFEQAVTALQNPLGLKAGPEQATTSTLGKTAQAN